MVNEKKIVINDVHIYKIHIYVSIKSMAMLFENLLFCLNVRGHRMASGKKKYDTNRFLVWIHISASRLQ